MYKKSSLLAYLFFFLVSILGCVTTQSFLTEEPKPMSTETFVTQHVVKETTVLRLEDGWEVGLQMIYQGEYTDATGSTIQGLIARISIWDGQKPQAETYEVYRGYIFTAGKRYQVVEIKEGGASDVPGTREGYLVIGELP